MQETEGTMSDFKALKKAGLLGELVAVEIQRDQFSLVGVNPSTDTAVVMYNTQLTERRVWSGSRYVVNVAKKLGVDSLTFRIQKAAEPPAPQSHVKLSSGLIISR